MRALITAIGLGANRPQDAVYPTSLKDANSSDYHGANNYVMRFAKGKLPPAKAFWSLTMYNDRLFFVEPDQPLLDQSATAPQAQSRWLGRSLHPASSPGANKESNWLPAPTGKLILMLRLYWPNETPPSILDGSWKPPAVQQSGSVAVAL